MDTIPSISREYLTVGGISGATAEMPVDLAVIPSTQEEPGDADWHAAVWDGTTAKLLIGPSPGVQFQNGTYTVWVRVTANPERPVIRSGLIRIT